MKYDRIGVGYHRKRRADPRWQARIDDALGDARTVVNVGAGAGSYEPADRWVVAIEPSVVMIDQRPLGSAPVVRAVAEQLPLRDHAFDAALVVHAVHHWADPTAGLTELSRVSSRQVVVSWDPGTVAERFWMVREYLPEALALEEGLATVDAVKRHLGSDDVRALPVPADCTDGFFGAHWRRPHAYLDPSVRASISALALLPAEVVEPAIARLEADLESGAWEAAHGDLLEMTEIDLGYRLVVAGD